MRLSLGRRADAPGAVHAALAIVFADAGTTPAAVRVIERSWFARLHGRAIATTRRRRIYLRGDAESFFANPELVLHEYCHVLLQWETGRLTHRRYLAEWLRRGYFHNAFEVEARRFATQHLGRFLALVRATERAVAGGAQLQRGNPGSGVGGAGCRGRL